MTEPIVIPVTVDDTQVKAGIAEVAAAFGTLDASAKKAGASGNAAGAATAAGSRAAAASVQSLASQWEKFQKSHSDGMNAMAGSLNAFIGSMTAEVASLTTESDRTTQALVNMGAQALPSLGPWGLGLAAILGSVGMLVSAERELAAERRAQASIVTVQRQIGDAYKVSAEYINSATTATERLARTQQAYNQALEAAIALRRTGFSTTQTTALTQSIAAVAAAQANLTSKQRVAYQQQLQSAAASSDAIRLEQQFGIQMRFTGNHSRDAVELQYQLNLARRRGAVETLQQQRQALTAERQSLAGDTSFAAHTRRRDIVREEAALMVRLRAAVVDLRAPSSELTRLQAERTRLAIEELGANTSLKSEEQKRLNRLAREQAVAGAGAAEERRVATLALVDAQYQLGRSQERLQAQHRDAATRAEVERTQREQNILYIGHQMELADREYHQRRRANENVGQYTQRRAAALQRLADLTNQLSEAERAEADRVQATRERGLELMNQLAEGQRNAALAAATRDQAPFARAQEAFNLGLEREGILSAGVYLSREQRVAQIRREVEGRQVLIDRLRVQEAAANSLMDQEQREATLATVRSQRIALETQQMAAAGRQRELQVSQLSRLKDGIKEFADTPVQGLEAAKRGFEALTGAMASNIAAWARGEQTFEESAKAMVNATLTSLSEIAAQEMIMELARGTASIFTNPAAAPTHFAAAGLYGLVAAGAGAGAAATAPSEASAGSGSSASRRPTGSDPDRATPTLQGGGPVEVHNYYGPVVGGVTATNARVGTEINRYQRAGAIRLQRAS